MTHTKKTEFLNSVRNYRGVQWLATTTGGDYNLEFTVQAKSTAEVENFFQFLGKEHHYTFSDKAMSIESSHAYLGEKFILSPSKQPHPLPVIQFNENCESIDIDTIDEEILVALSTGRDPTISSLARRLNQPVSSVQYRKDRLKERGIIVSEIYRLNPSIIERYENIALVNIGKYTKEFSETFLKYCADHPNIVACHRCIGPWDFKLLIEAENRRDLVVAIEELSNYVSSASGRCRTYQILRVWEAKLYGPKVATTKRSSAQ